MAKINLTTQQNQENLSAVASLGVLVCMIVAIVGIKLWWFKHRLSFEQSSTLDVASDRGTPAIILPRRSKQPKYKKDKRYSQQIYESVEVQGVFRQKREDDVEIQRPQQLPPVRIRQTSESTSSLILPPPRAKRRDQVHSTAFEDLEIAAPPLSSASSADLTAIPEINTKITLTFEEFERQFKLREIKPEVPKAAPVTKNNQVTEIPMPPLRLNRSSSTLTKPEKPQHILKSSQSITIPEFRKVLGKRSTGLSSPKEDLTKIDNYDEPKIFETFGERRPTGYIKYEEVDGDLQEQYERELNTEVVKNYQQSVNSSPEIVPALKALRNERIIYNNDLDESPDGQRSEEYNFNRNSYKWKDTDYKEDDFINHKVKFDELDSGNTNEQRSFDFRSFKDPRYAELEPVKEPELFEKQFVTEPQASTEFDENSQDVGKKIIIQSNSVNGYTKYPQAKEEATKEFGAIVNENVENFDATSLQEDWPQFEEKIETPQVNVRRFNNQNLVTQNSFDENDIFCIKNIGENSANENESENQTTETNKKCERTPTEYARDLPPEPFELKEIEEWREDFSNKFYNQIRSFMTAESREVTFDSSADQNFETEKRTNSALQERRPTGYVRKDEYYVTFSDESDEACKENSSASIQSNVEIVEIPSHKVNFKDDNFLESKIEKFTLNQRRPTGFVRSFSPEAAGNSTIDDEDDSRNVSTAQVKFAENTDFKDEQEIWDSDIKQRRPTGYTKQLEIQDVTDDEENSKNYENNTDYTRSKESLDKLKKQVNFQLYNKENNTGSKNNEALNQRRPTSFMTKEEIAKHLHQNSHEEETNHFGNVQRRRKKELKCLSQPAPIFNPSNYVEDDSKEFDRHLWQEMEKDVEKDVENNFEEEFAKIRHSYEVNEADFLEIKDEQPNSPLGFGKTIEDDWENFQNFEKQTVVKQPKSPQEIKIAFSDTELNATTSILKEHSKLDEEDIEVKPRKSKVTFDFKTNERVIPAREDHNYSEEDLYYDGKSALTIPPPPLPQPRQRVSNINYNIETTLSPIVPVPTEISLFGSHISRQDNTAEDSWSAIRKHRSLTEEFQNLSIDTKLSPIYEIPPSKLVYRNPMAQLALQRAKEVRADMDGFKSRSINDKKSDTTKRQREKFLNLSSDTCESTDA